jgi:hypothetical protein
MAAVWIRAAAFRGSSVIAARHAATAASFSTIFRWYCAICRCAATDGSTFNDFSSSDFASPARCDIIAIRPRTQRPSASFAGFAALCRTSASASSARPEAARRNAC